jgi:hypothetical protein
MSPRPPAWWKAPLAQWCREVASVLLDYGEKCGDALTAVEIGHGLVTLDRLLSDPTVEKTLRQLFRKGGPAVMTSRPRVLFHRRRRLALLALDAELRPRKFSAQLASDFDPLSPEQQLRVCAAGCLLLVAAVASQAVPMGITEQRYQQRYTKILAMELLYASVWLYGSEQPRTVITLVKTITGRSFDPSSMRWWVKHPPR